MVDLRIWTGVRRLIFEAAGQALFVFEQETYDKQKKQSPIRVETCLALRPLTLHGPHSLCLTLGLFNNTPVLHCVICRCWIVLIYILHVLALLDSEKREHPLDKGLDFLFIFCMVNVPRVTLRKYQTGGNQ